jgi:serine-type D-Ala-D-Ala carboxypeptidase (penicillin-binding protein 5/6)
LLKKLFLFIFCLVLIIGAVILNIKKDHNLISPVANQGKVSINQWFPKQVLGVFTSAPQITAKSAFFVEAKDGTVLFSKNAKEKLQIASLVKVMTVLIALENKNLDDTYLVSTRATEMEPDEMILLPGEKLTLKELLYGIFLVSANDAAEVISEGTLGSRDEFIKAMNEKAKLLGMNDTNFVNPTGLDEDSGSSYSSAYDLVILTRYLIRHYPEIINISKTEHIILDKTDTHQDYEMYSGINLLTTYPGVVGFKTGFTPEAGYTIITLARKNNDEIIGVLLGSEARRDETRELLDYSFSKL